VNEDGIIDNDDLDIVNEGFGEFLTEYYNKPLTVLAKDQDDNLLTTMEVWIDEASVGYTGASFTVFRTLHEVYVQPSYTEGTHTYVFTHWEDNSTENPRILLMNSSKTITAYYVNQPPSRPATPSGPLAGYVYTVYTYFTNTTDPDDDEVLYEFSWGDNTTTITDWCPSGQAANASHQWDRPLEYTVKVRAKDAFGAWSDWSDAITVALSQNDANSGDDAGDFFQNATLINTGINYTGTLYATPFDPQDGYKFYATNGQNISAYMCPPPDVNFDLTLRDPEGYIVAASQNGPGCAESISYQATASGYWRIDVFLADGEGQYSFEVDLV